MKIDEAIGDLSVQAKTNEILGQKRQAEADKLGIEALKRLQHLRADFDLLRAEPLPGETED